MADASQVRAHIDKVIDLARRHPLPLLAPLVLIGLLTNGGGVRFPTNPASAWHPALLPVYILIGLFTASILLALFVLVLLLTSLAWGATAHAARTALDQGTPDIVASLRVVRQHLVPMLTTGILYGLAVAFGFVLFLLPGIFLAAQLSPWAQIVLSGEESGPAALRRAWDMTRGRRMPLFLVGLLIFAIVAIGSMLLGWLPFFGNALAGILGGLGLAAYALLGAIVHDDARTRTPTP